MANKTIVKDELKPFLDTYLEMLVDGLLKDDIIEKIQTANGEKEVAYKLTTYVKDKVTDKNSLQNENDQAKSLDNFKRIATNIYLNLNYNDSHLANTIPFIKIIEKFEELKLLKGLRPIFDEGQKSEETRLDLLKKRRFYFNSSINKILEFYTYSIASQYFEYLNFTFEEFTSDLDQINKSIDLIGKNKFDGPDLLFEIKYRKNILGSLKETIFQSYEILTRYNKKHSKNCYIIVVIYTDETSDSFDKVKGRFNEILEGVFSTYLDNIFLIPVSTNSLQSINNEFDTVKNVLLDPFFEITKFSKSPKIVIKEFEETIDSAFLKSPTGTLSVWVKLNPTKEYSSKLMNNQYVISHSTKYTGEKKSENYVYPNVFALSLTPDNMDITHTNPTAISWRFWISNDRNENTYFDIDIPELSQSEWVHLLVRWNHKMNLLQILVNSKIVTQSHAYRQYWPHEFSEKAFLGTWGNKVKNHYINLPLFRVIASSEFLNDTWVKKEQQKRPKIVLADFIVGKWRNEWTVNGKLSSEICDIHADGSYYVNDEHWFNILDFEMDQPRNKITFTKSSARSVDQRNMNNILNIESMDLLVGTENNYYIKYTRL